jgi:hypothetical protein
VRTASNDVAQNAHKEDEIVSKMLGEHAKEEEGLRSDAMEAKSGQRSGKVANDRRKPAAVDPSVWEIGPFPPNHPPTLASY